MRLIELLSKAAIGLAVVALLTAIIAETIIVLKLVVVFLSIA